MILSEYEAKRAELDRRLQEVGEREAAHKMELSVKYQAECKRIQSQIGQLKKEAEGTAKDLPERQDVLPSQVSRRKARNLRENARAATGVPDGEQHRNKRDTQSWKNQ